MTLAAAILAQIWGWAFPVGIPERMEHYESRLVTISEAVAAETRNPIEAAAVVELWRRESMFRLDVHAGTKTGDHGRARCMGSIHPSAKVPDWDTLAGIELPATRRCAVRTMQFLRSGWYMCAPEWPTTSIAGWAEVFAYYGAGHCVEKYGDESLYRAKLTLGLAARLRANPILDAFAAADPDPLRGRVGRP